MAIPKALVEGKAIGDRDRGGAHGLGDEKGPMSRGVIDRPPQ